MYFLNSHLYILIFNAMLIWWSTEANAGPISEPNMEEPAGTFVHADYENVPSENKNVQNSPPETIAAVEIQIISELRKMVKSNMKGSDEAAGALTETETCMKNGMVFSDALHEGLRKMFPNIIGQQESTGHDETMMAIILFSNMRKYMQELISLSNSCWNYEPGPFQVYILNLLQQYTGKYGHSNNQLNSSTDTNAFLAGNRQSLQSSLAKQATMKRHSDDDVNKSANDATSGITSPDSSMNASSLLATYQSTNSSPKDQLEPKKNNIPRPPSVPQMYRSIPRSNIGQEKINISSQSTPPSVPSPLSTPQPYNNNPDSNISRQKINISSQPITFQMNNNIPKSQPGHMQSSVLTQSNTTQSSSSSAAKNQSRSQQRKPAQNIPGENAGENQQLKFSENSQNFKGIGAETVEMSNIKSDLADLSNTMNRWRLDVQKTQQQFQATSNNNSLVKTVGEKRQDSDLGIKKEENKPTVLVNDRKTSTETLSSQRRLKRPKKDQQLKNATLAGLSSTGEMQTISKKPQLPGDETPKEIVTSTSQKNQENFQLQQAEAKPSFNQSSAAGKIIVPKKVVQSPREVNSLPKRATDSEVTSVHSMSKITGEAISGSSGQKITQFGTEKLEVPQKNSQPLPLQGKMTGNQKGNLKKLISSTQQLKVNAMDQLGGVENLSAARLDGKLLNSQQTIHNQNEIAEQDEGLKNENILEETEPEESVISKMKRQAFRSETPLVRTLDRKQLDTQETIHSQKEIAMHDEEWDSENIPLEESEPVESVVSTTKSPSLRPETPLIRTPDRKQLNSQQTIHSEKEIAEFDEWLKNENILEETEPEESVVSKMKRQVFRPETPLVRTHNRKPLNSQQITHSQKEIAEHDQRLNNENILEKTEPEESVVSKMKRQVFGPETPLVRTSDRKQLSKQIIHSQKEIAEHDTGLENENIPSEETELEKNVVSTMKRPVFRSASPSIRTLDKKQLNSQQTIYNQKETTEHEEELDDENKPSEETTPQENVVTTTKRQVFRSETPSVRTHAIILQDSEPVRETPQYENGGYGVKKEYVGYPSVHKGSNNEGIEGYGASRKNEVYKKSIGNESSGLGNRSEGIEEYMESGRNARYEATKESEQYILRERYEKPGKKFTVGEPWNRDASSAGASESTFTSKSGKSQSWIQQKSASSPPFTRPTQQSGIMEHPENEENIITTKEEYRDFTNDSDVDKLMKSTSQPENQKWQRRVLKIVEQSKPSGEIIRTVSRKGNWSSGTGPMSFDSLIPFGMEKSVNDPAFNQADRNGIIRMVDEINEEKESIPIKKKESIPIKYVTKSWKIVKPDNTEQTSLVSNHNENAIPKVIKFQKNAPTGRLIFE